MKEKFQKRLAEVLGVTVNNLKIAWDVVENEFHAEAEKEDAELKAKAEEGDRKIAEGETTSDKFDDHSGSEKFSESNDQLSLPAEEVGSTLKMTDEEKARHAHQGGTESHDSELSHDAEHADKAE